MVRNIILLDIDGCLNYYPETLKFWVNLISGSDYTEFKDIQTVAADELKAFKSSYRQSGIMEKFAVKPDVIRTLNQLKVKRYLIVIITARNHYRYYEMGRMTVAWLLKNKIPFDQIIFRREKLKYLSDIHENVAMIIDDDEGFTRVAAPKYPDIIVVNMGKSFSQDGKHYQVVTWSEIKHIVDSQLLVLKGAASTDKILKMPNSVVIIPFNKEKNIVGLLYHYRTPNRLFLWEFPAGKIGVEEGILDACIRELKEETCISISSENLIFLGILDPYPGISTERHFVFWADVKKFSFPKTLTDDEEKVYFKTMELSRLARLISSNLVTDAKTIACYYLLSNYLTNHSRARIGVTH